MVKNIEFSSILFLDSMVDINRIRIDDNRWKYTATTCVVVPIGVEIPVYKRRHGCIGAALVKSVKLTKQESEIIFEYRKSSKEYCDAVNTIVKYSGQLTSNHETAVGNDVSSIIPGLISATGNNRSSRDDDEPRRDRRPTLGPRVRGYDDYDDDYDDEY